MGASSTLRSPHMAGATTILVEHLPATSMRGLGLPTAHSPVMGGISFLPGTSPPSSTGVVYFLLALVTFPVHLHWLPQAMVFWARCCTCLWRTQNTAPLPVWMPPGLSSALGTDHLLPLQLCLLYPALLPHHLPRHRSLSLTPSRMQRPTSTYWEGGVWPHPPLPLRLVPLGADRSHLVSLRH
jgi:hypothetical protein